MVTHSKLCATALALILATPLAAQEAQPAPEAPAEDTVAETPNPDAAAPKAETVVATVNGQDITLGDMLVLRERLPAQYQSLPDDALFQGILEQLIQQEALAQSVEGEVTKKDEIAMEVEKMSFLAAKALDGVATAAVTDEALQAAYDARYANAEPATEYHAAHILVPTEEEAAAIKTEIDGGADFAEQAKEHSQDGAAQNGGDLGWFGPGMMVKPFEDAVMGMEAGAVSDPIQTQFGWHVVKLIETREAEAPSLDEVREELGAEIQQAAVVQHLSEITAGSEITRATGGLDPSVLRNDSLFAE